jgi:hypothetical protein
MADRFVLLDDGADRQRDEFPPESDDPSFGGQFDDDPYQSSADDSPDSADEADSVSGSDSDEDDDSHSRPSHAHNPWDNDQTSSSLGSIADAGAGDEGELNPPEGTAREVAMHAWGELSIHRMHATTQARLAVGLQYAIVGINIATALMATIETQVVVDDLEAAVTEDATNISGLRLLMVLMPLSSGLCLALLKGFNPGIKAAALEYSSAAIRSEIYRWRTRTGEYAWGTRSGSRQAGAAGVDAAAAAAGAEAERQQMDQEDELRCRKRFREHVSHLSHGSSIGNVEMSYRGGVPAWHGNDRETAYGQAATAKSAASILDFGLGRAGGVDTAGGAEPRLGEASTAAAAAAAAGGGGRNVGTRSLQLQFAEDAKRVASVAQQRELSALWRGSPYHLTAAAVYDRDDDGYDEVAYDDYIEFRLNPVLGMYRSKVPTLELQLQACQLGIYCLTALSVLLSAMDITLWLPLTLLLTTSISAVGDGPLQLQPKLLATNHALTQLKELQLWWSSLERHERDILFNFEVLVDGVESAYLAGLGSGVPYSSRKLSSWRAEDNYARDEFHKKRQKRTDKHHREASKKEKRAERTVEKAERLARKNKELQSKLADEKRTHANLNLRHEDLLTVQKEHTRMATRQVQAWETRLQKAESAKQAAEEALVHARQEAESAKQGRQEAEAAAAAASGGGGGGGGAIAGMGGGVGEAEPRPTRLADESWATLEDANLIVCCRQLGYGTRGAWEVKDFTRRGPWSTLSKEQKLAANRLGLYQSDFDSSYGRGSYGGGGDGGGGGGGGAVQLALLDARRTGARAARDKRQHQVQ